MQSRKVAMLTLSICRNAAGTASGSGGGSSPAEERAVAFTLRIRTAKFGEVSTTSSFT
jgi:hypothetical protein